MNDSLEQLRTKLYRSAQEYHRAAIDYYLSLEHPSLEGQNIAIEQFKLAGEAYLTLLSVVEQRLLTIPIGEYLEAEFQRIRPTIYSVGLIMKSL